MEISNKALAWLVVAAIVVSIFGTTISLWNLNNKENLLAGNLLTNDTGLAQVTVSQSVVLRFAINATNFGTGSINSSGGYSSCNLAISGQTSPATIVKTGCNNFNPTTAILVLENAGTSFLNVTLNVSGNATNFTGNLPGDAIGLAAFQFNVSNNETGSCVGTLNNQTWSTVPGVPTPQNICTNLSWTGTTNSLVIGLNVTITNNASQGAKSVTFFAQGTNI